MSRSGILYIPCLCYRDPVLDMFLKTSGSDLWNWWMERGFGYFSTNLLALPGVRFRMIMLKVRIQDFLNSWSEYMFFPSQDPQPWSLPQLYVEPYIFNVLLVFNTMPKDDTSYTFLSYVFSFRENSLQFFVPLFVCQQTKQHCQNQRKRWPYP